MNSATPATPATPAARWARISLALDALLELPLDERSSALARHAKAEPDLADELHALLASAEQAARAGFLTGVVAGPPAEPATLAGQRMGAYTLEAPLGQGGTGSVWRARRDDGRFAGQVAIKLLHLSLLGSAGAERFQREGNVLAKLTHPNIARLLDAGVAPGGQPYLVIELVQGQRIDLHCQQQRLSVPARLALFADVLAAMAHAHSHLVIHRDIKPANILVSTDGQVKLLDFGIAKLLENDTQGAEQTALTRDAGRVMTPEYAAPEQVLGQAITTATDVYGLGLLLYQLLSGQMAPQRKEGSDLPPPSRAVRDAAERRRIAGDLDTIVLRALKADPAERYPTVSAMADDLARHQAGLPVLAQPDSALYRLRKWVLRNKAASAVVAAVGLALLGGAYAQVAVLLALAMGVLAALWQARRAQQQSAQAQVAQRRAEDVKQFIASIFTDAHPRDGSGGTVTALDLLKTATERIEVELASSPAVAAELGVLVAQSCENLGDMAAARLAIDAALPRCLRTLGPRHPLSLQARCLEVGIANNEGNPDHVRRVMDALLADLRLAMPGQAGLLVEALREHSYVLAKQQLEAESLAAVQEAVAVAQQHLGPVHAETMAAMGLLANTYQHFRRMDEAVHATEALMKVSQQAFGHQRPHSLLTENERLHGLSLAAVCRPADAEPLARRVLAESQLLEGGPHGINLAQSLLALSLGGMGRHEQAIGLLQEVLAQQQRIRPQGYWDTASFAWRLALHLLPTRRASDLATALAIEDQLWASHDGQPLEFKLRRQRVRAQLAVWAGHWDEALALAQGVIDEAGNGMAMIETPRAMAVLACAARQRCDANAALHWAQRAMDAPRANYLVLDLARCATELGLAHLAAGQHDAAADLLAQAMAAYDRAQVLPQTLQRCDAALGQVLLCAQQGDRTAALATLRWVAACWQQANPGSVWQAQTRWHLALLEGHADDPEAVAARAALVASPLPAMQTLARTCPT